MSCRIGSDLASPSYFQWGTNMRRKLPESGWENKLSGGYATIVNQDDEYVWYVKPGGIACKIKRAAFLDKWRHVAFKQINGIPVFSTIRDGHTTVLRTSWRGDKKDKLTIARSILNDSEPLAIINTLRDIIRNIEAWLREQRKQ